ncbi:MAG: hypothetical protein JO002_06675 [Burkholderiaceae bacterium]|nr:hypothetical protein [Burkholderiaceae bacterium]
MKNPGKKLIIALAAVLASAAAHAADSSFDPFKYSTVGVWAGAPLGVSARLGLAIPVSNESAITAGGEAGLYGSKQFVGYRMFVSAHGVAWGGVELAHWKTRSHPWLADDHTDYYGVEAHMLFFRAGLMFPKGEGHHPTLAGGVGLGF